MSSQASGGPGPGPYRVTAQRDVRGWRAHIEELGAQAVIVARDLADLERRIKRHIWGCTGVHPADITLDCRVRLPPASQLRLELAEQLGSEAAEELEGAVDDFLQARYASADIVRLVGEHRIGPRPLAITNDEILRHGMSRHPDAIGIRWDDEGRFLTITCRDCVEATRAGYGDLPPDGQSILLYRGPMVCDRCQEQV